jgi:hypothetical protein
MRTRSIAPGAARWPQLICAPSNAGPVGLEQATAGAVAEHDLGVGADIDQQRHRVIEIRPLGEHHAGGVGARRVRRCTAARRRALRCNLKSSTFARSVIDMIGGERERRAAELHRVDAEQQVMHDRVADDRRFENVLVRRCRRSRATSPPDR